MIHRLTVGFLDGAMVARRRVVTKQLLPSAAIAILEQHGSRAGDAIVIAGEPIDVAPGHMVLPWYSPKLNRAAVKLAVQLVDSTGIEVADVEHGRMVSRKELLDSLNV